MLQFLLDTDHLTLLEHHHPAVTRQVSQQPIGAVGLCAVTVEESLRGRLTSIAQAQDGTGCINRNARLVGSLRLFERYPIAPFDQAAENEYQKIRALHLRVGTRDQKIAAIALASNLTMVTRNRRDFGQVTGVIIVDWSV